MLDAVRFNGKTMSTDNRRLHCLKQHQKDVNYEVLARVRLSAEVNGDLSGMLVHVKQQNNICVGFSIRLKLLACFSPGSFDAELGGR